MMNLLRAQLYKLFRDKFYYVILAAYILVTIGGVAAYWSLENTPSTGRLGPQSVKGYILMCKVLNSGGVELFEIVSIIFVSLFVASGFRHGTIKSEVSFGYSRASVYLAKLFSSMIGVAGITAAGLLASLAAGTAFFGFGAPVEGALLLRLIRAFISVVLVSMGLCSVYVLLSFLFKEPGWIIGVYSGFTFLITNLLVAQLAQRFEWVRIASQYTPQAQLATVASMDLQPQTVLIAAIYTVVLVLASTLAGCAIFKKQDIA